MLAQDISRGGNFLDTTPISFIKVYGLYFRVGVIFAKKTKAQKRENYPHANISTFTVLTSILFDLIICTHIIHFMAHVPEYLAIFKPCHCSSGPVVKLFGCGASGPNPGLIDTEIWYLIRPSPHMTKITLKQYNILIPHTQPKRVHHYRTYITVEDFLLILGKAGISYPT